MHTCQNRRDSVTPFPSPSRGSAFRPPTPLPLPMHAPRCTRASRAVTARSSSCRCDSGRSSAARPRGISRSPCGRRARAGVRREWVSAAAMLLASQRGNTTSCLSPSSIANRSHDHGDLPWSRCRARCAAPAQPSGAQWQQTPALTALLGCGAGCARQVPAAKRQQSTSAVRPHDMAGMPP